MDDEGQAALIDIVRIGIMLASPAKKFAPQWTFDP